MDGGGEDQLIGGVGFFTLGVSCEYHSGQEFISAPGLPIILCIDGDLVVYILLTGFKCHLCSVCCATQNNNCKGIFKAYMSESEIHIDTTLALDSTSVEQVVSSYTNIQYVDRTYSSNWREYVPLDAHGIVVRPHTSCMGDVDTDAMSIVLDIISKLVKSIMTELCCESIMIYGIPTREFVDLARSYKCHYIYPLKKSNRDDNK
jgi:hypothetical protein